jgi:DUF971 family protein
MSPPDSVPRPLEVRLVSAEKCIEIDFDSGEKLTYPAEFLRVESPSAEVKGHAPDQRITVAGRRHVAIVRIEPVGHYAIRITFDDLHDTGIYSWDYLYEIGRRRDELWRDYLAALEREGKRRDP